MLSREGESPSRCFRFLLLCPPSGDRGRESESSTTPSSLPEAIIVFEVAEDKILHSRKYCRRDGEPQPKKSSEAKRNKLAAANRTNLVRKAERLADLQYSQCLLI